MAAPYHKTAGSSHSFFSVSIPNQLLPPGSESATTSPAYSPSVKQEPWPETHVTSSNVGLPVMGSVPIPSPRISHSSTSASFGMGVTKEEQEAQRRNPLVDLMESENLYAEQLGLIIRVSCLIIPYTLNDVLGSQFLTLSELQVHGLEKIFRQLSSIPCSDLWRLCIGRIGGLDRLVSDITSLAPNEIR